MENVFAQIIPLTLAMVIPMPMLKATRYLLLGRPILHLSIFILTWGVSLFLILSTSVYIGNFFKDYLVIKASIGNNLNLESWIHIGLGILLIGKGLKKLKESINHRTKPIVYQLLDSKPINIIKMAIKTEFIGTKNSSLLLLTIYILITDNIAQSNILLTMLIISVISMFWFTILLAIYLMLGKDKNHTMEVTRNWLASNQYVLVIFVYIFIGVSALSNGLGGLIQVFINSFY